MIVPCQRRIINLKSKANKINRLYVKDVFLLCLKKCTKVKNVLAEVRFTLKQKCKAFNSDFSIDNKISVKIRKIEKCGD